MVIYFQGLAFVIQDVFSLKSYKALILPLGLCIVVFTLYMFPNTVEYTLLGFSYLPVYISCQSFLSDHHPLRGQISAKAPFPKVAVSAKSNVSYFYGG
jgi:hypothetical protein